MHDLFILTGASRGLGLAMARQLCRSDARLLCLSRATVDELDELARQQGADLLRADHEALKAAVHQTLQRLRQPPRRRGACHALGQLDQRDARFVARRLDSQDKHA